MEISLVIFGFRRFFVSAGVFVSVDVWLSYLVNKPMAEQGSFQNMAVYTGLVCGALFFGMLRSFLFYLASLSSAARLHDRMIVAILKSPVLFFDTNPLGRILNRFSKDVGAIDEVLPTHFLNSLQVLLFLAAATILPATVNAWVLLAAIPFCVTCVYLGKYYLKSSRELKRLESICRSPIFSHFSETMNGLDTIRNRGRQRDFMHQFCR